MNAIQNRFRYLPITNQAKRWGLYVTCCGSTDIAPEGVHPPQGHPECYGFSWQSGRVLPEYQIIFLTSGAGEFECTSTGQRKLTAGDVAVLFPGLWHRYRPIASAGWQSYWIGISGSFVDSMVQNGLINPECPIMKAKQRDSLVFAYDRLLEFACQDEPETCAVLGSAAMEVLARVFGTATDNDSIDPATQPFSRVVQDRIVAEAIRSIWNHAQERLTVAEVVSSLPVSRRSLERRFQNVVGHTILDEIVRCRVERAKRLLRETDLPLKAIASQVGFSSVHRMARVFDRSVGQPPATYRKVHTQRVC